MKKVKSFIALGIVATLVLSGTKSTVALATESEEASETLMPEMDADSLPIEDGNEEASQEITGGNSEGSSEEQERQTVTDIDEDFNENSNEENISEDFADEIPGEVSDGNSEVSDGNAEAPSEEEFVIMPEEISGELEDDVWNEGISALKISGEEGHVIDHKNDCYTVDDCHDWYICRVKDGAPLTDMTVYKDDSDSAIDVEYKNEDKYLYIKRGTIQKGENKLEVKQKTLLVASFKVNLRVDNEKPKIIDWGFNEKDYYKSNNGFYSEKPLTFQIFSEDEKNNPTDIYEYASGVEYIELSMTKDGNRVDKKILPGEKIKLDKPGTYKIESAIAHDVCGNESNVFTINKYVYIADSNDTDSYSMYAKNLNNPAEGDWKQEGDGKSEDFEWYSANKYGNDTIELEFKYNVYGAVAAESELKADKGSGKSKGKTGFFKKEVDASETTTEDGIKTTVTEKYKISADEDASGDYTYTYRFFGEETRQMKFHLAIDNTAPEGTFNVSFVQNKKGKIFHVDIKDAEKSKGSSCSYEIGKEGKVITNDDRLVLNLISNDIEEKGSGLEKMTYSYECDGIVNEDMPGDIKNGHEAQGSIDVTSTIKERESVYRILTVVVEDAAGNKAEFPVGEDGKAGKDKVSYEIDTKGPEISFDSFIGETYKDPDGTLYYNKNISKDYTVTDMHLDPKSIEPVVAADSSKPVFTKTIQSGKNGDVCKGKILMKQDGFYNFSVTAKDTVNNVAAPSATNKVVIDTTAPEVEVKFKAGHSEIDADEGSKVYAKNQVSAVFTVKEKNIKDGGISAEITGTDADGNPVTIAVPFSKFSKSGDTYTASEPVGGDGEYTASIVATDKCEHTSDKKSGTVIVDSKPPIVHVDFDKGEPINGKYYKTQRVATISVEDFTFDKEQAKLKIEGSDAQPEVSGWSGSGNHYEQTVTFNADGRYKFEFDCTDKAGNKYEGYESDEFIIDRTEPKIAIGFDNDAATNNMYYKSARTATISIDELSFDPNSVVVTPLDGENTNQTPQISSFSGGDKNHTANIEFTQDGRYGFAVSCTDLAGNSSEPQSSEVFIIDTTVPEVTISGVTDQSANNGVVAPVITYVDKNVDTVKSKVTTVGKNNGDITSTASITQITDGYRAEIADLPHEKKYDDVYVITANVYDLAGNEAKEEIMFSVNRFGSVYYIDDKTASVIDNYYTNVAPEISITEVNIDDLEWKNVSVGRDGEIRELTSGKDYIVSQTENEKAWKSFTYTVKPANFSKDGKYSVVIASKDKATNEQDNVVKDKEIEFAVDTTEPGIAVSGFENNGVYEEESHLISFNVTDNMGVTGAAVFDNGQLLKEYTEEELTNDGFTEQVELPSADNSRDIKIVSTDVAGNTGEVTFENIVISLAPNEVNATKEQGESEVLGEKRDQEEEEKAIPRNSGLPVIPVAAGSTAVVIGGYALLLYIKKKKFF